MKSTFYLRSFSFKNVSLCVSFLPETRAVTFQRSTHKEGVVQDGPGRFGISPCDGKSGRIRWALVLRPPSWPPCVEHSTYQVLRKRAWDCSESFCLFFFSLSLSFPHFLLPSAARGGMLRGTGSPALPHLPKAGSRSLTAEFASYSSHLRWMSLLLSSVS